MSYKGRELTAGNYLKLDDLQSQFNSSTTTFNLTSGGTAFYPGSAFSIQVVLGGVIQEPESAYTINQSQITFASAPGSGDDFFCIALGVSLGIGVPGEGTVTGTKLSKPFSYDDGLLVLDSTNDKVEVVGNIVQTSGLVGIGTTNPLQRFQIGVANTVGVSTDGKVFVVTTDGKVGIGTTNPTVALDIIGNVKVGGSSSITVGSAFIKNNAVGLGTTNTTGRNAGISTAAGTLIFNVTTANIEFYTGSVWVPIKSTNATGGTITFSGGKTIHTFTGSGTFSVNSGVSDVEYLVVAGGGGGGGDQNTTGSGGGGAGGFRTGSAFPVSPGPYIITVGGGGAGGYAPSSPNPALNGVSGSPSIFSTITSQGGGGGGGNYPAGGIPGGSGGGGKQGQGSGGSGNRETGTSTPAPSQGNNGGTSVSQPPISGGGGGGGATGVGGDGTASLGGNGGNGTASSISGSPVTYAGGGGGGASGNSPSSVGAGGSGGGTPGSSGTNPAPNATTNTGGGGGGVGAVLYAVTSGNSIGGAGGSGIVIIAYPS